MPRIAAALLAAAAVASVGSAFQAPPAARVASHRSVRPWAQSPPPPSLLLRQCPSRPSSIALSLPRRETRLLQSDAAAAASSPSEDVGSDRLFEGLGKGIVRDYRARLPHFWSDITDGLNVQCLAATMFLFFACLAPAVGFGGLFGAATGGQIGTVEMISSTAICGMVYALLAAQPLTIIGSTGPVLAFVACLAQLAESLRLPFLPLYAWTGLWSSAVLLVASLTSGSNLVRYLTRFTDEIFSTLISTIFVVEAVSDIGRTFTAASSTLTKALLSLTCASVTFMVSSSLKKIRASVYFNRRVRNTVSNFAPTVGILAAAGVATWAKRAHGAALAGLPTLNIPQAFGTTTGRPWLVPLLDLPVWARWAALLPALMASVLLFLDQNITVRLVNNPRWRLTKGRRRGSMLDGMHADMLVLALLTAAQSLVGLPWLVAATVRSLSHVGALARYDDKDGRRTGTIEQRVTGLSIHALIAGVVLFPAPRRLLAQVPLSALMGLFLYLGVSSLDTEMWARTKGFFEDRSVAPKQRWSGVPAPVVRLFTGIQLLCLGAMFWVKESPFGVLFPVVIAMLAPLRFGLERFGIIKREDMSVLDEE